MEAGDKIPRTHSETEKWDQAKESRGQGEDLQAILAKMHLKKRWGRESSSELQRGQHKSEWGEGKIALSRDLVGMMSQAIFHKKSLSLSFKFSFHRRFQLEESKVG